MAIPEPAVAGARGAAKASLAAGILNLPILLWVAWPTVPPHLQATFAAYWIFLGLAALPFFGAIYYRYFWPYGYPDVLILVLVVWMGLSGFLFIIEVVAGYALHF